MTREEKSIAIEDLTAQLADVNVVYLADISGLDADTTSNLRRACFKAGINRSQWEINMEQLLNIWISSCKLASVL